MKLEDWRLFVLVLIPVLAISAWIGAYAYSETADAVERSREAYYLREKERKASEAEVTCSGVNFTADVINISSCSGPPERVSEILQQIKKWSDVASKVAPK